MISVQILYSTTKSFFENFYTYSCDMGIQTQYILCMVNASHKIGTGVAHKTFKKSRRCVSIDF